MANRWGNKRNSDRLYFSGSKITADADYSHEIKRRLLPGRKAMTNPDSTLKNRDITLPTNVCSQSYSFSSSHVWMWELDDKKHWAPKNWRLQTVVLEKTLESPLASKQIKLVNPEETQSWIFIRRTNAEDETWCEEPTHWKRPWYWEMLKAGGEGDNRGWDGWMASPTQWTWVWASSRSWWWRGKPGVLWFMGSQRVWHNWATELS